MKITKSLKSLEGTNWLEIYSINKEYMNLRDEDISTSIGIRNFSIKISIIHTRRINHTLKMNSNIIRSLKINKGIVNDIC